MTNLNIILLCLLIIMPLFSAKSEGINDNKAIASLIIESKALGIPKDITVYLPKSYNDNALSFPTLYVLDGQRFGMMAAGFQQELSFQRQTPEFIVVAINGLNPRERRIQYNKNPKRLKKFLVTELIPTIDKEYRTNQQRLIFGWELAGSFLWQLYAENNSLFNSYISSSSNYAIDEHSPLTNITKGNDGNTHAVGGYFGMANNETWMSDETKAIAMLEKKSTNTFKIKVEIQHDSDHWSTAFFSLYQGLRDYYKYYKPLKFADLSEFENFGGIQALHQHYVTGSDRYQITTTIPHKTSHQLMYLAMKENNYESFLTFVTEFSLDGSKSKLPLWPIRMAKFHQKNGNIVSTKTTIKNALVKFPDSVELKKFFNEVNN